ncbi:MAG: transposase [Deltaproteobacteria bacterium]|nr:transposase [Deltaproteobacteria bacterium]
MSERPKTPDIPDNERTPLVVHLLEVVRYQSELIQRLRDEIAIIKGDKPKPNIKPSGMEKGDNKNNDSSDGKRPGSAKRSKTKELEIHEVISISPEHIPEGSLFKSYKKFAVQGIIIRPYNIVYRLQRWKRPDGSYIEGQLPPYVQGHFDASLISYIQYQYFQCHVTQPLLLEQLWEFGIDISSGHISRILIEGHDNFHREKDELLQTGLEISRYINVDDTGARHKGNNGVCTHIGNELFAWFKSTNSKSRINFLTLLGAGKNDCVLNSYALDYMESQKLPEMPLRLLIQCGQKIFTSLDEWKRNLKKLKITNTRHIQIATEGALIGGLIENGLNPDLAIVSDDAGQFNILLLLHALCWVHAERTIHKIVPYTDEQRQALKSSRDKIWKFYADLKAYKENPTAENKTELENRFDNIFLEKSCFGALEFALKRLHKNKAELLLVLDRPEIPLHNNASESDIREYVKRRKVSGGTQSLSGRKSRDTFTSLKKTCRKLKVSFWEYLNDRNFKRNSIPQLSDLMRKMSSAPP